MRLDEILDTTISYHNRLNPKIWDGRALDPEIRENLLKIAQLFINKLKIKDLKITDIILTGSLANFNYTKYSDFDLHVVVDYADGGILEEYFTVKKSLWNEAHDMKIKGYDVELYVQNSSEKHHSSGVYSLVDDRWVVKPSYNPPSYDEKKVASKAKYLAMVIDNLDVSCDNINQYSKIKEKIFKMRQDGLESSGEFSNGNLVFKVLRNNGYIKMLHDKYTSSVDACYTI